MMGVTTSATKSERMVRQIMTSWHIVGFVVGCKIDSPCSLIDITASSAALDVKISMMLSK
jgi:hypothetical protein